MGIHIRKADTLGASGRIAARTESCPKAAKQLDRRSVTEGEETINRLAIQRYTLQFRCGLRFLQSGEWAVLARS